MVLLALHALLCFAYFALLTLLCFLSAGEYENTLKTPNTNALQQHALPAQLGRHDYHGGDSVPTPKTKKEPQQDNGRKTGPEENYATLRDVGRAWLDRSRIRQGWRLNFKIVHATP